MIHLNLAIARCVWGISSLEFISSNKRWLFILAFMKLFNSYFFLFFFIIDLFWTWSVPPAIKLRLPKTIDFSFFLDSFYGFSQVTWPNKIKVFKFNYLEINSVLSRLFIDYDLSSFCLTYCSTLWLFWFFSHQTACWSWTCLNAIKPLKIHSSIWMSNLSRQHLLLPKNMSSVNLL